MNDAADRTLLVDASVFITLADVGSVVLPRRLDGTVSMPQAVVEEITSAPAESELERAVGEWIEPVSALSGDRGSDPERAAERLGASSDPDDWSGDVALLAAAMEREDPVVITDDKPLRRTCKALSIPVSGSIGVVVRAVERGDLDPEVAKETLYAMDEVGARLSASLVRRAERMIDDAAEK